MRKITIALVLLSLGLSSCSLDYRIERKEDRLLGRWAFHKAFYRDNDAIFRNNVFNEFAGDIIEFYPGYEAGYDDASERFLYFGNWEIFAERDRGRGDDIDFFLDMYFFDDRGFESFSYVGECTLLTREKLHLRAYDRSGVYTFKLRRVD